jgi:soluble lytic murein transglycosylase-like protein
MSEVKLKTLDFQKHISNAALRIDQNKKEKLAKAAKEFESLLTMQMLKAINKANGGLFGEESFGGETYDLLFEMELAKKISASKSLGIANAIYKKITGEDLPENIRIQITSSNSELKLRKKLNASSSDKKQIDSANVSDDSTNVIKSSLTPAEEAIDRLKKYESIIKEASANFGVSERLIKSVILAESSANPYAVSKKGAKGLMQLMDETAREMGVNNPFDPKENIFGGVKYLSYLLKIYDGNEELALAAYNAGLGNVAKYKGIPPFKETINYIKKTLAYSEFFKENYL